MWRRTITLILFSALCGAEVIDRTAIVVGRQLIKASDIDRDIRITSFLNGQPPDFTPAARKKAGSRLIEQALIRERIRSGEFQAVPVAETADLLSETRKGYANDAEFKGALGRYGITEQELRDRMLWQLTVLRFIEARFATDGEQTFNNWMDQRRKETKVVYLEKSLE